jgi:predicted metal-dependent enzyme (double-stranded beta helix superfamily)
MLPAGSRTYSIPQLVEDLRREVAEAGGDEREILKRVRPLAERIAASSGSWLQEAHYEVSPDQGFGVRVLHEEPDHTLAIFVVSWLPGRGTPAHDHGTWAVVAGVVGAEHNEFYERVDDRSRPGHAELKKTGDKTFGPEDVLAMRAGVIHAVWNRTEAKSVSLHIYGKNIQHTGRSQFDVAKQTETPYVLKLQE